MEIKRLVLGTRNRKKRLEIEDLFRDLPFAIATLDRCPNAVEVEETGSTFLDNATLKAVVQAKALGEWVLGEDSGLSVPALAGAPGVYSARYAGQPSDDEKNNNKLLAELASVADERRQAFYSCVAVVADPQGVVHAHAEGRCWGKILRQRRGEGGFGYDPLFLIEAYNQTFGELPLEIKQQISHRARALGKLKEQLARLFLG